MSQTLMGREGMRANFGGMEKRGKDKNIIIG